MAASSQGPYEIDLTRTARRALAERLPFDVVIGASVFINGPLADNPHRVGKGGATLAAVDVNDPNFVQKSDTLTGADLGTTATPLQGLTSNKELAPAFGAALECQRLGATAANR